MRLTSCSALIATAYLALVSQALPRPATPSYSVVAVDGGQNEGATPTTIVHTVTDSDSTLKTVSVTIEETQAPSTTTVLSMQQAPTPSPQTVTLNGQVTTILAPTVVVSGARNGLTTTAVMAETTTVLDAEHTTIYQQGPTTTVMSLVTPSTSYFDDGMWHTSYGVPVWPTKHWEHKQLNQTTPCSTRRPRATADGSRLD